MNRLSNGLVGLAFKNVSYFSAAKKAKMELTLRTPYQTLLKSFDGFSRIITKTNEVNVLARSQA